MTLSLDDALRRYGSIKIEEEKKIHEIKEKYWRKASSLISELLDSIEELDERDPPRDVDENLLRIALRDRSRYVPSIVRLLSDISSMEELGKRLPELSKFHVSAGRYLLVVFEKDMRRINSLMKELGELHMEYMNEISSGFPTDIDSEIRELLGELRELEKERKELEEKMRETEKEIDELRRRLEEAKKKEDENFEVSELEREARTLRIKIKSKVSKLQKPLKRMRIEEAKPFIEDSSFALDHPEEFLSVLVRIYPKLERKYRSAASWAVENLKKEVDRLRELEKKLETLRMEEEREEQRAREIRRRIQDRERELKRIKETMERIRKKEAGLRERLEKAVERLEDVLGEEISWGGGDVQD